jgi:MFS family permease
MSIDSNLSADAIDIRRSRHNERLLLPATFVTTAGNAFQVTAAAILVFHAGQSALSVGWLFIAVAIPQIALAVLFGRLVDKVDRRTLSVAADLVSAVTALALPVWLWIGGPATLGSYLANFLLACSAALFMPASNALVKERIRDQRLGMFNARFEMANNSGMLIANVLAGILFVLVGPIPLFIFNSGTFVASAVLTWLMGRQPSKAAPAGAGEAKTTADAKPAVTTAALPINRIRLLYINAMLGLVVANTLLVVVILSNFHKGPWLIGVVDALAFCGFFAGGACYARISSRVKPLQLAVFSMLANLVMWCLEPLNWILLMAAIPIGGFCYALTRISSRTLLMQASPPDRVGRIFGTTQAAGLALTVVATAGISVLADATTVPYAFWALGALQVGLAIGAYISLVKPLSALGKPAAIPEPATEPATEPVVA